MSNNIVGDLYAHIIKETIDSSRTDFEEYGMDDTTLQELMSSWQHKLTQQGVAHFPWDPAPAPVPMPQIPQYGGLPQDPMGGHQHQHHMQVKSDPLALPGDPNAGLQLPGGNGNGGGVYIKPDPDAVPGQSVFDSQNPGGVGGVGGAGLAAMRAAQHIQSMSGSRTSTASPGLMLPQHDGPAPLPPTPSVFSLPAAPPTPRMPQHDGPPADFDHLGIPQPQIIKPPTSTSDDEDAINSDLDDSDDGGVNSDGENADDDENAQTLWCQYEKVQRTKNKWKCVLKDGVVTIDGKEYVFGRGAGEFEW